MSTHLPRHPQNVAHFSPSGIDIILAEIESTLAGLKKTSVRGGSNRSRIYLRSYLMVAVMELLNVPFPDEDPTC